MAKRGALDAFFKPTSPMKKKPRLDQEPHSIHENHIITTKSHTEANSTFTQPSQSHLPTTTTAAAHSTSNHATYPFPISSLPPTLLSAIQPPHSPAVVPRTIDHFPDLDCLYYEPFLPRRDADQLFHFLRENLFFYRVIYQIKRAGMGDMTINTPRFTSVFGVDASAYFAPDPGPTSRANAEEEAVVAATLQEEAEPDQTSLLTLHSTATHTPLSATAGTTATTSKHPKAPNPNYNRTPRPLPQCLSALRLATEAATGARFNICLVNYYASGKDSISFHSDDERFLGPEPAIASFSLGGRRDFILKRKAKGEDKGGEQVKLPLGGGDMLLMRGRTQANWLHSIPKRGGKRPDEVEGRINITFRRALVKGGTENYYQYNVGNGGVFKWDYKREEMVEWEKGKGPGKAEKD